MPRLDPHSRSSSPRTNTSSIRQPLQATASASGYRSSGTRARQLHRRHSPIARHQSSRRAGRSHSRIPPGGRRLARPVRQTLGFLSEQGHIEWRMSIRRSVSTRPQSEEPVSLAERASSAGDLQIETARSTQNMIEGRDRHSGALQPPKKGSPSLRSSLSLPIEAWRAP